jgi:hypothetical protein
MEELQSTDVLDREILEDARRKAQRILKTADDQVAVADKSWEDKIAASLEELRKRHGERLEEGRVEVMARLPLDKRRLRLEKIDSLLREAASRYAAALSREKQIALLADNLALRAGETGAASGDTAADTGAKGAGAGAGGTAALAVTYRLLSGAEAESLVKNNFPGCAWKAEEGGAAYLQAGKFPGIVVDSGEVRISVSVDEAVESLLEEKRGELTSALLGREALDA